MKKAIIKDTTGEYIAVYIINGAAFAMNVTGTGANVGDVWDETGAGWAEITTAEAEAIINSGEIIADSEQPTTAEILSTAADIINGFSARSAWSKGVNDYALELLDSLADLTPDNLATPEAVRRALLNGADTWERYSYGGCALIYDCDIAERLCTPSELRRCRGGERNPNSRENWLDVQARALYQAGLCVETAIKEVIA